MNDLVKNMMGFDTFIREKFGEPVIWGHTRPVQQNYANMWQAWQARVLEGYKLVPKEPTFKQIDALKNSCEILRKTGLSDLEANGAYKAMIEAVEK